MVDIVFCLLTLLSIRTSGLLVFESVEMDTSEDWQVVTKARQSGRTKGKLDNIVTTDAPDPYRTSYCHHVRGMVPFITRIFRAYTAIPRGDSDDDRDLTQYLYEIGEHNDTDLQAALSASLEIQE